jgi:hypothetical protein
MRAAVPLKSAVFSSLEAPLAMRLNAFHRTGYSPAAPSGGKLLSNMQRRAPKASMQVSI